MRYYPINSKVLLIADIAIPNDSRYDYIWEININRSQIEIVYGYKIYYTFTSLGVKHIKLTIIDKQTKMESVFKKEFYIVESVIELIKLSSTLTDGLTGVFFETSGE